MSFFTPRRVPSPTAAWHWRFTVRTALGLLALACGANALSKLSLQSAAVVDNPQVRAELVAHAPQGVGPGKTLQVGLLLQHQPHWHTYWINPGDSGLATRLEWKLPPGVTPSETQWPLPRKIAVGNLANLGYEGQALLRSTLTVSPQFKPQGGSFPVRLHASWLVCNQECIPQEGDFALDLPLQGGHSTHSALFAQATANGALNGPLEARFEGGQLRISTTGLPPAWRGKDLAVFPETAAVFAASALPTPQAEPTSGAQRWDGPQWSGMLALSPQRNSSPTAVAVLLVLGDQAVRGEAEVQGPWPAPAPALSDTTPQPLPEAPQDLGAYLLALGAAFLGGLLLNLMPCVFPVLAIKALGLAQSKGSRSQRMGEGLAYMAGVVLSMAALGALLLALRAAGQQLGWGFHLQSPRMICALALLFTLIALNLAGLLEFNLLPGRLGAMQLRNRMADAALSGALAVVVASPCTAPFMGASLGLALTLPAAMAMGVFVALGLGLALPFALLSTLESLSRLLPRPGVWMEQLRQFMVFPMAGTVLWLLWVLASMGGVNAALAMAALLLVLAMCIWAAGLQGTSRRGFVVLSLLIAVPVAWTALPLVWEAARDPGPSSTAPSQTGHAPWQPWSQAAVEQALSGGQPVFVDFTAAWCITCQFNKQNTLARADVLAAFAAKDVQLLRADWTQRDPAITQALAALGRSGVPVYVIYQPGKAPQVLSEILRAEDVLAALNAI